MNPSLWQLFIDNLIGLNTPEQWNKNVLIDVLGIVLKDVLKHCDIVHTPFKEYCGSFTSRKY